MALLVEAKFSKDEILQMYLNEVPYGSVAYGIEEAAQTYFGKSVHQISLAEAALLAGLPAAPTHYSPFGAHPKLAKARQKQVLDEMVEQSYITETQNSELRTQNYLLIDFVFLRPGKEEIQIFTALCFYIDIEKLCFGQFAIMDRLLFQYL